MIKLLASLEEVKLLILLSCVLIESQPWQVSNKKTQTQTMQKSLEKLFV